MSQRPTERNTRLGSNPDEKSQTSSRAWQEQSREVLVETATHTLNEQDDGKLINTWI